jgi:hypothetical protein
MPNRLIVGDAPCDWRALVIDRLDRLVGLPVGWDGYRAPPVAFATAYFALQMLNSICADNTKAPQIVPGSSGDLQVEWHSDDTTIELHVHAPNAVTAYRESSAIPDGEEVELSNDFRVVLLWIREMSGAASAAVTAAA